MLTGLKPKTTLIIPCEQRLHFCCVSCRAKSGLCLRRGAIIVASFRPFVHRSFQTAEPRKDLWYLNLLDSHVIQVVR